MKLTRSRVLSTAAVAAGIMLAASALSPASAQGEAARLDRPDAQVFVTGADNELLLVHGQTPTHNTVCSSPHGVGDVDVMYDENTVTLSPGHCALLESGQVRVRGAHDNTAAHVSVHNHHHSHAP